MPPSVLARLRATQLPGTSMLPRRCGIVAHRSVGLVREYFSNVWVVTYTTEDLVAIGTAEIGAADYLLLVSVSLHV